MTFTDLGSSGTLGGGTVPITSSRNASRYDAVEAAHASGEERSAAFQYS